jgi:hypothetical protein
VPGFAQRQFSDRKFVFRECWRGGRGRVVLAQVRNRLKQGRFLITAKSLVAIGHAGLANMLMHVGVAQTYRKPDYPKVLSTNN